MAKTYKNYYVLIPIRARLEKGPDPEPSESFDFFKGEGVSLKEKKSIVGDPPVYEVKPGFIFMGSRFVTTLLELNGIAKILQIYQQEEVLLPMEGDSVPITSVKISTQSDAVRLGVFSIYSIALIPEDATKIIPPYGKRYVSRIPASGSLDARTVASSLYNTKFTIEDSGITAVYVVEPNSVKAIHLKKYSGNITFV